MTDTNGYTLWTEEYDLDIDDPVLGTGLTLQEAAKVVREYGNARPQIQSHEYPEFYSFELIHFHPQKGYRSVIAATVPKTADFAADRSRAMEMIDVQTVHRHKEFWPGRISSDAEFRERLERIAERRLVRDLDRQIVTKLVDALLAEGYLITCCIREDDPTFKRSVDRDGILDLLFNLDMAEMHVHKDGKRSWIMLVFDESGWDVVADYSVALENLIDPIVDSYVPWNGPDADEHDRGYSVFVLPSAGDLERGDAAAEKAFSDFVQAIEKLA